MHTQYATPPRRRWAAAIAVTAALAFGPAILVAAPAFAATVDSPAEGSTGNPSIVFFDGTGTADNVITVTYPGVGGPTVAGEDVVMADGTFGVLSEFSGLTPGQTTVTATITEATPTGTAVGSPVVRTFSFATAPVAVAPFAVTSPAQGDTVTTTTPTFTGTGRPGDTVTITYSNSLAETSVAGEGIIGLDGTFSIATNFSDLTPGAVEVRTISSPTGPGGSASDSANIYTNFFFSTAPVPAFVPNPPAMNIVPESITVSDSKRTDRGLQVTATGFGQREELVLTFTAPSGEVATFVSDTGFFADDTGSYAGPLVLFGNVAVGTYTVTITGATGGLVLSDTFTVIPDPAPAGTGNGGVLAATGSDDATTQGLLALGAVLILSGVAMVSRRRREVAVSAS